MDNEEAANVLEQTADLLETQGAWVFRVRAYRNAARSVRALERPLTQVLEREGLEGLEQIGGVGKSLASFLAELLTTGRVALLDRLRGQVSPEDLLASVPGIGEKLAQRIHDELGIETLEELELAAHDGRLAALAGFGARRTRGVREILAGVLSRSSRRRARQLGELEDERADRDAPSIETLLEVDADYREKAASGALPRIAPRRFNPEREAWLPVQHAEYDGWSFTALYSNTARAHERGKTRDWVVLYYERNGHEDQCTVVTETSGSLRGKRVVRGRESECGAFYREQ